MCRGVLVSAHEESYASIYRRAVREARAMERSREYARRTKHTHVVLWDGRLSYQGTRAECESFALDCNTDQWGRVGTRATVRTITPQEREAWLAGVK